MSDSESNTDTDDASTDNEDDYKRTTLYLRPGVKRNYERWQKRLELDHVLVEDAYKREVHEAIIAVALNNTDEFIDRLNERVDDPEKFEEMVKNLARV